MHDFLKACKYAIFDEKVSLGFQLLNIKKLGKREHRVDKGLFGTRFGTMEVKHTNENKVYLQNGNVLACP
jgi:hypothetical protein